MTGPGKRKGDRAELEVEAMYRDHMGIPARRAFGAGRRDDVGDIAFVPHTTVSVANRKDIGAAVREKPREVEEQRERGGMPFAVTWVRLRGTENGEPAFRIVMTPQQYFAMYREAL